MPTYRVSVRQTSDLVYEIECDDEDEARDVYSMGDIVSDEWNYDDIEKVVVVE